MFPKATNRNVSLYRAVYFRWARAGPGTPPSSRCSAVTSLCLRRFAARGIHYYRRLARLLLLQQ